MRNNLDNLKREIATFVDKCNFSSVTDCFLNMFGCATAAKVCLPTIKVNKQHLSAGQLSSMNFCPCAHLVPGEQANIPSNQTSKHRETLTVFPLIPARVPRKFFFLLPQSRSVAILQLHAELSWIRWVVESGQAQLYGKIALSI